MLEETKATVDQPSAFDGDAGGRLAALTSAAFSDDVRVVAIGYGLPQWDNPQATRWDPNTVEQMVKDYKQIRSLVDSP